MGVAKDVSSAAMPYVILAGVVVGIYIFRDKIKNWFTLGVTNVIVTPVKETVEEVHQKAEDFYQIKPDTVVSVGLVDKVKDMLNGSVVTGFDYTKDEVPGFGKPDGSDVLVFIPDQKTLEMVPGSVMLPMIPAPLVTEGYGEALQNVSNLVTGTAADALANANAIRLADTKPSYLGLTYADLAPFDTNRLMAPIGVNDSMQPVDFIKGDMAMSITPRGWSVWRLDYGAGFSKPVAGVSGGTAPFGRSDFAFWAREFGI